MNSNNQRVLRFLKEGRGQGQGENYKPWLKISDYSSKGRASRIQGIKTNRIHHLHSDNQLRSFLIFEFCNSVTDIRESFPLLDVMEIIDDKSNLRFDKFCDDQGEQLVICTNFLLTIKDENGCEKTVARTIKNTTELNRKITLEKLEIERRYWSAKGIDWRIITEKQLSRQYCKNIEWVRETLLNDGEINKEELASMLYTCLLQNLNFPVAEVLKRFEKEVNTDSGKGLYLFRFLIAKKIIKVNMQEKINLKKSVNELLLLE